MNAVSLNAVLILGHGSKDRDGIEEFEKFVCNLRKRLINYDVMIFHAFFELAHPSIPSSIFQMKRKGVKRVFVFPAFLFQAKHLKEEIPEILSRCSDGLEISMGSAINYPQIDDSLLYIIFDKLRKYMGKTILFVFRGSTDISAVSMAGKVVLRFREISGFKNVFCSFIDLKKPLFKDALMKIVERNREVIVFPYFLFTGVLVKRIYDISREVSLQTGANIFVEDYIGKLDVLDYFSEKIRKLIRI